MHERKEEAELAFRCWKENNSDSSKKMIYEKIQKEKKKNETMKEEQEKKEIASKVFLKYCISNAIYFFIIIFNSCRGIFIARLSS